MGTNHIVGRTSAVYRQLLAMLAIIMIGGLFAGPAQAADPVSVSFTLEGCNTTAPAYTPGSYDPDAGDLICGDGVLDDGGYTTGNLGKGWNELDLVPHRVTTDAGNSAPTTQTYTINVVADHFDVGHPGYDIISVPILNLAKSHTSCAVIVGIETVLDPGVGGTDKSLARSLTITQDQNTICVFDYVERLALGSHLYPGSSLHSNLLNELYDTGGVGNKDVSIPVKDILPQELHKDMSAKQDQIISWNITKVASPANLDFNDSCLVNPPANQAVNLTIKWYVQQITPSTVLVTTNVYATNPSKRTVLVDVTDVIFGNTGSGEFELDTLNATGVAVTPGDNVLVLTHTFDAPANITGLRDVATATYTDSIYPGVEIPGQTTAEASADIELGTTYADVIMTDTETLTGGAFSYTAVVSSSTTGLGDPLGGSWQNDDPATGVWTSAPTNYLDCPEVTDPEVDPTCEVVFTKTVSVVASPVIADELLQDTAALDSMDELFHQEVSKTVDLSVDATVTLTLLKEIPDFLQGSETASFTFEVCQAVGTGLGCIDGADIQTVTLDFTAGETAKSADLTGLTPGVYLASEILVTPGWGTLPAQWIDLNLPICSGALTFVNDLFAGGAEAAVAKITIPDGVTGWEMTLSGTTTAGDPVSETLTSVTANTGFALFPIVLEEGTYTITETKQTSWDLVSATGDGCAFTVDLPADTGRVFECTFTNVQAQIELTKTCDDISKIGDDVDYTITLNNTTGAGAENLVCAINDSLLNVLETVIIASGANHIIDVSRTVLDSDLDPLVNTVTASCSFADDTTSTEVAFADASCETDLFQPTFGVTKTGDDQAKVGDVVNYTITLSNTSGPGTPDLTCTATDTLLGEVFTGVLPDGDTVLTPTYTVPVDAPDPLVNDVTLSCALPSGFTNVLNDATASHSTDLFVPTFGVTKTGDDQAKVGDVVNYTITLTNGSSADTPLLTCTADDSLLGTVFTGVLLPGNTVLTPTYTVPVDAPDPLVNEVTLSCLLPGEFTNILTSATASHKVDLYEPSFTVLKSCTNEPVPQEGPATWDILVTNTGDVALDITVTDDLLLGGSTVVSLAAGASTTLQVEDPGTGDDPFLGWSTVSNTVNATAVIDPTLGVFTNEITPDESTAVCDVGSRVNLLKRSGPNGAPVVDPNSDWTFSLWEGVDGFEGTLIASDNTLGDPDGLLDFDFANLDSAQAYSLCEQEVPAGWSVFWQVYNETTGTWDTVIPYNPNEDEDPPEDLGNRCIDIGDGTVLPLTAGGTLQFRVDNTYPGGEPRTPGYWKNWNTCTGGGQQYTADTNGGYLNGFWLLEDVLDPDIGGGIWWDDILTDGYDPDPAYTSPIVTCAVAVDILDQREIGDPDVVGDGAKHANDAAYTLAMHLLAAQLNFGAGAADCDAVRDVALAGEELLDQHDFNGTGDYLLSGDPDYAVALSLANELDIYNNGALCNGPAVSFINPKENDVVNGQVLIDVEVFDLFDVTQVEFFVDGASLGTDTVGSDGWTWSWDSTTVPEGSHTLLAQATNANPAGAETGSADININVYTVSITNPADGDIVGLQVDGATSVDVTADAAGGVTQVEFAVDGTLIGIDMDGTDGWSATWDLTGVTDGDYSITATANDGSLTIGSDSVTVTLDNEAPVPDVPLAVTLTGASSWQNKVKWNATATITVAPVVEGALVSGSWDGGSTGSCTTDVSGECAITLSSISSKVNSVTFTVESITATGYTYTPGDLIMITQP